MDVISEETIQISHGSKLRISVTRRDQPNDLLELFIYLILFKFFNKKLICY